MIQQLPDHAPPKNTARRWTIGDEAREYYQEVLDSLPWPGENSPRSLTTLGLTSCGGGEGVSTTAAHLAAAAAAYDAGRILLVDGNLARPSIASTFGVQPCPGLIDRLRDGRTGDEDLQESPVEGLWILAAGRLRGSAAGVYLSPRLPGLVQGLSERFALTIFDLPAAAQASCVSRLAGLLDGVLLVIEAERARWEVAQRVKELLGRAHVRLLGAVLNKRREQGPEGM